MPSAVGLDEALRSKREEVCLAHMTAENDHDFVHFPGKHVLV